MIVQGQHPHVIRRRLGQASLVTKGMDFYAKQLWERQNLAELLSIEIFLV